MLHTFYFVWTCFFEILKNRKVKPIPGNGSASQWESVTYIRLVFAYV